MEPALIIRKQNHPIFQEATSVKCAENQRKKGLMEFSGKMLEDLIEVFLQLQILLLWNLSFAVFADPARKRKGKLPQSWGHEVH